MLPKALSLAPWRVCLPFCLFLSSGSHVTPSRDVTTAQVNTMGARRSRVCVLKHMLADFMEMAPTNHPVAVDMAKVKVWAAQLLLPMCFFFCHHVAKTCCKQQMPASRIPVGINCLHICSWERADLHLQPHRQKDWCDAPFVCFFPPLQTYIICKWYVLSFWKKETNKKNKCTLMCKSSTKEELVTFNCAN